MLYQENDLHDQSEPETLRPYRIETISRQLASPITIKAEPHHHYRAPRVVEWIDMETGELLGTVEAMKHPGYRHAIHMSERQLQREFILARLRPEVKPFALFVLKFRNRRRGLSPGIDKLVKWYAHLHNKRPANVRRFVPRLREIGILEGDSLVGTLWQIPGATTQASDHIQEETRAHVLFGLALSVAKARDAHVKGAP